MTSIKYMMLACCVLMGMCQTACTCNKPQDETAQYDSPKQGTIYISVDEAFKPVITEQIKVYQSTYPNAHIIATYKSEADCFRDLQQDSTRMIIVAKPMSTADKKTYAAKLSFSLTSDIVAYDAVSLIVNTNAKDSLFTLDKLKKLLTRQEPGTPVVVDGNNATSTVRYLLDSLLQGQPFGPNVQAAEGGSRGVIDYVAKNPAAIGFVGSSWVGNMDDPQQAEDSKSIKFGLLECKPCDAGTYAKPSPESISYMWYPLVRPLYYILKENTTGLGTGFVNFLALERGQLIFRRSYLVPGKINLNIRKSDLELEEDTNQSL